MIIFYSVYCNSNPLLRSCIFCWCRWRKPAVQESIFFPIRCGGWESKLIPDNITAMNNPVTCNNLVISALYFGIWPCPAAFYSLDFVSAFIAFWHFFKDMILSLVKQILHTGYVYICNLLWSTSSESFGKMIWWISAQANWSVLKLNGCFWMNSSYPRVHNLLDYLLPNVHNLLDYLLPILHQ